MTRLCVDTSAYSHLKRGDERIATALDGAEWVGIPAIVIGELEAGFVGGARRRQNQEQLGLFVAEVEILVIDEAVALVYGEVLSALREAGTPLPTNDIWIASVAVRHGASVLTCDAHFRSIRRVASVIMPPFVGE